MKKPQILQDKTILVTGAGAGIGRTAAKYLAAHGATIILLGRTVNRLESIYDEITQAGFPQPAIYPLDLASANPDQYNELAQRVDEQFGRLDGLLHNAATLGTLTPVEHYNISMWYTVMQTNLHARFLLTRATLRLLRKPANSSVIFTSSSIGRVGKAYWGAYSISKFGNESLMQILAEELENSGIRVNCVNPGPTRTRLRARAYPGELPEDVPLPDAIMPVYLHLLGPDSIGTTGKSINAQQFCNIQTEAVTEGMALTKEKALREA